jgi:hypothetical protein
MQFKQEVRGALEQHLKSCFKRIVTRNRQTRSGTCEIGIRSNYGPPYHIFARIRIMENKIVCKIDNRSETEIDLADPKLIDMIEEFVKEAYELDNDTRGTK